MLSRVTAGVTAGLKQHPFSVSTYFKSFFSSTARTFASYRRPATRPPNQSKRRTRYLIKLAKQRRAARQARRDARAEQLKRAMGDPIRGIPTPFVESLTPAISKEVQPTLESLANKPESGDPTQPPPSLAYAENEDYLNHYLSKTELKEALDYSRDLSTPLVPFVSATADPTVEAQQAEERASHDASSTEAINRITSLANASSRDRTKANIRRIIDTFGRHNTDGHVHPKNLSSPVRNAAPGTLPEPTPRAGPDTGSSEVQIGILTAKIRVLMDRYEGVNFNDKVNKRNLRLLVHRRQKLLKYMEKKERGSGRWQNLVETLGLSAATYRGELEVR